MTGAAYAAFLVVTAAALNPGQSQGRLVMGHLAMGHLAMATEALAGVPIAESFAPAEKTNGFLADDRLCAWETVRRDDPFVRAVGAIRLDDAAELNVPTSSIGPWHVDDATFIPGSMQAHFDDGTIDVPIGCLPQPSPVTINHGNVNGASFVSERASGQRSAPQTMAAFTTAEVVGDSLPPSAQIRYQVPRGLQYAFERRVEMDLTHWVEMVGVSQEMSQKTMTYLAGVATVREVSHGKPSQVRLVISEESGTGTLWDGEAYGERFALAGLEVVVTIQGKKITEVLSPTGSRISLDDTALDLIENVVVLHEEELPGRAVSVDDQWTASIEDHGFQSEIKLTVDEFVKQNDRVIVGLLSDGQLREQTPTGEATYHLEGVSQIDLATGLVVAYQASGPINMTSTSTEGGVTTTSTGSGDISVRTMIEIQATGD